MKYDIRKMPCAPNQWEVYNTETGQGFMGFAEKSMAKAYLAERRHFLEEEW